MNAKPAGLRITVRCCRAPLIRSGARRSGGRASLGAPANDRHARIAEEIRSASQNRVVMCDRSVLDNYAYMVPASRRQRAIERFVDHWMGTYDLLFKVPISGQASPDGVRDTDEFFMRAIDEQVERLLVEKRDRVSPPAGRS